MYILYIISLGCWSTTNVHLTIIRIPPLSMLWIFVGGFQRNKHHSYIEYIHTLTTTKHVRQGAKIIISQERQQVWMIAKWEYFYFQPEEELPIRYVSPYDDTIMGQPFNITSRYWNSLGLPPKTFATLDEGKIYSDQKFCVSEKLFIVEPLWTWEEHTGEWKTCYCQLQLAAGVCLA